MVSLDDIRVRRRRTLRLIRAALSTCLWRRRGCALLRSGCVLLPLSAKASHAAALLPRKLSAVRLTAYGAIAGLSLSSRLFVRNDVVRRAAALAVGDLLVVLVLFGVLQDDIPGVEKAWEDAETAEGEVNERVGATDALLHPYYASR